MVLGLYIFRPPPGGCSSAWLECRTVTAEVAGSSPVSPARFLNNHPVLADGVLCFSPSEPDMADLTSPYHVPVLLPAIVAAARGARRVVDATLGDGGHAAALLEAGAEVLGIDRDPEAIAISRRRLGEDRIHYVQGPYSSAEALAAVARFEPDFILLDLGVSSRQLDEAERGFTFRPGAALDMRMGGPGESAADLLNHADAETLETYFGTTATSGGLADWQRRSCVAGHGTRLPPAMIS
jgi:hypothetical protein